ncbi:tyrosine-type recombinase/integrase [Granulicella sp. L60]|uniref:tyrosine-type recombinase/integrase n=1 Tax=Granulicella sp. L60 TaxID=1641866 RepID=UPI00131E32F7|nr:tyrosine-type recombinase/integrase [Granulicella sp. L60]
MELQKIADQRKPLLTPMKDALKLWINGMKGPAETSIDAYRSTSRRIERWADRAGVVYVSDVTPAQLDAWRASWTPDAEVADNRLALATQASLLIRLKSFFYWATAMEYTTRDPTLLLRSITPNHSQTWPLTPDQFVQLLAATYKFDEEARHRTGKIGQWLRAIFLVQRWTGLRVGDVLYCPKSALAGNRLRAVIRKKMNRKPSESLVDFILPDHVVAVLNALPRRPEEHPDYWFWSRRCSPCVNTNKWVRKIDRLNNYLDFKDEDGEPLDFRSHMLRDTFAVEMLLAGMELAKVSKLLTHESVATTERYYAKWTRARRQQLEDEAMLAMQRMGATFTNVQPAQLRSKVRLPATAYIH